MTTIRGICLLILSIGFSSIGLADSVRISQIDTGSLLVDQTVTLYLSVTDQEGEPIDGLDKKDFQIFESGSKESFANASGIKSFRTGSEQTDGVNFLLLIDNSGSMYQTLDGKQTTDESQRRITHAKRAVESFLKSIKNPQDQVGLAAYNTYYQSYSSPTKDFARVEQLLDDIRMPTRKDAFYSEIYGGVLQAVKEFQTVRGRKAIIILSDGENRSFYQNTKTPHNRYGTRIITYSDPLQELQKEGISLYVIHFGKNGNPRDRNLMKIGEESGGMTFNAQNLQELEQVYLKIMDQIRREYIVTYRANMEAAEKKHVKVVYTGSQNTGTSQRFYFSSTVFGVPQKEYNPWMVIAFVLSLAALWGLSRMDFDQQRSQPTIEVLDKGNEDVSTRILYLNGEQTVIGGSIDADLTIAGHDSVKNNHATVVFDRRSQRYKLTGKGKLHVNNRPITTKILEPGDLINIDGVTMVFDSGSENESSAASN